jgi:hypothetical protein
VEESESQRQDWLERALQVLEKYTALKTTWVAR